jgi:hypothetical protein
LKAFDQYATDRKGACILYATLEIMEESEGRSIVTWHARFRRNPTSAADTSDEALVSAFSGLFSIGLANLKPGVEAISHSTPQ